MSLFVLLAAISYYWQVLRQCQCRGVGRHSTNGIRKLGGQILTCHGCFYCNWNSLQRGGWTHLFYIWIQRPIGESSLQWVQEVKQEGSPLWLGVCVPIKPLQNLLHNVGCCIRPHVITYQKQTEMTLYRAHMM